MWIVKIIRQNSDRRKDFLERIWLFDTEDLKYCHSPYKNNDFADITLDASSIWNSE